MPLDQASCTLQDTAALWSIDAVSPRAVVTCACDALIAGLDSTSLRILAGLTRVEADYQVLDILPAALAELGLDFYPRESAQGDPDPPRRHPAFARHFAAAGYTVVTFDYRHWGDSDGHPRGWLSLSRQQSDWRAAVTFARQLDGTDPDRVALWGFSMGGAMALTTAAADPRITAVIAVCPLTDGLAAWLEPAPPGTVLRMLARALRETITRRPVTMPLAGKPGAFAALTAPEALPGFAHVTAGRPWRNEISTSWLFPLAAFRPITAVPKITAPVLYQIAQHDGMLPAGAIDKAIRVPPEPRSAATPRTTSDPSAPNTTPPSPPTPATSSAPRVLTPEAPEDVPQLPGLPGPRRR